MAELFSRPGSRHSALSVDLTPMVDLGFLLIAFFMYSTTLTEPKAMRLNEPDRTRSTSQTSAASTLTIYLDSGIAHFAEGIPGTRPLEAAYLDRVPALASEIEDLQHRLDRTPRLNRADLTVLIRAGRTAPYRDVIRALDLMTILHVKRYMLLDQGKEDEALVRR